MPRLVVILGVIVLAACANAPAPDASADRAAIAAASADFAAAENAGSVAQILRHFADDLIIMGPNEPALAGAEPIAQAMQRFHDAFAVQVAYSREEIVAVGDWGFDRGTYRYTLTPKVGGAPLTKMPLTESGKYLWLYRRASDGSWKQSRVMWNSSDPVPAGS
ncbi:MAG: YybH family protein [Bryobacteraceae bacterium]